MYLLNCRYSVIKRKVFTSVPSLRISAKRRSPEFDESSNAAGSSDVSPESFDASAISPTISLVAEPND